jgi:hypothetical protein
LGRCAKERVGVAEINLVLTEQPGDGAAIQTREPAKLDTGHLPLTGLQRGEARSRDAKRGSDFVLK